MCPLLQEKGSVFVGTVKVRFSNVSPTILFRGENRVHILRGIRFFLNISQLTQVSDAICKDQIPHLVNFELPLLPHLIVFVYIHMTCCIYV